MSAPTGHKSRLGNGIQADFDTAAVIDELASYVSESMTDETNKILDETLVGKAGRSKSDIGGKPVKGSIVYDAVYDSFSGNGYGIEPAILALMGTGLRVGDYNRYTFLDALDTYLTMGINKQTSLYEFIGSACNGVTITLAPDTPAQFSFDYICKNVLKTGDAGITNSIATVTALAKPAAKKLNWNNMAFRLGDTANVLVDADRIKPISITITIARNLDEDIFSSKDNSGHTDAQLTERPCEDGFRDVTIEFVMPRYEDNTFVDFKDADTNLQADITFSLGGSEFIIYMPRFVIDNATNPIDNPGVVTQTITCTMNDDETNAFMQFADAATLVTNEIAFEVKSDRSAIPT